jgi:tubulin polyglutamylase complex subunit 2
MDREFLNDIGLNIMTFLESQPVTVDWTRDAPVAAQQLKQWENDNYPYLLPEALKRFFLVSNGLRLDYTVLHQGKDLPLGRIRINSLHEIKPTLVESEDISVPARRRLASDVGPGTDSDLASQAPGEDGGPTTAVPNDLVAFVLDHDPEVGITALFYCQGHRDPQIWFQDLGCEWNFIATCFEDYFRVMAMHLGVPGWQLAFTPAGLPSFTVQWLAKLAPVRLRKDMEARRSLFDEGGRKS